MITCGYSRRRFFLLWMIYFFLHQVIHPPRLHLRLLGSHLDNCRTVPNSRPILTNSCDPVSQRSRAPRTVIQDGASIGPSHSN